MSDTQIALRERAHPEQVGGSEVFEITPGSIEAQPTGELLKTFVAQSQSLLRDELNLARLEVRAELKKAAGGGAALTAGLALAGAAFLFALLGIMFLLARVMDAWLASFVVAAALVLFSLILLESARLKLKKVHLKPEETLGTIKEDGAWIKETLRGLRSPKHGTT